MGPPLRVSDQGIHRRGLRATGWHLFRLVRASASGEAAQGATNTMRGLSCSN